MLKVIANKIRIILFFSVNIFPLVQNINNKEHVRRNVSQYSK